MEKAVEALCMPDGDTIVAFTLSDYCIKAMPVGFQSSPDVA
jgi:hypothetical protein